MSYFNLQKLMSRKLMSLVLFSGFLACLSFFSFSQMASANQDPIQMLQGVTDRVMGALKGKQESLRSQPVKLHHLVDNLIVPYVDFEEMGRWVVGRNAWQKADLATRNEFVQEFKILIVRSYATALLAYTNQKIEFSPLRGGWHEKSRLQISSHIVESGKPPVRMDYNLLRHGDAWRVYDIIIEGVSLVQGFRAQFSEDLRQGGLQAVVQTVKKHNAAGTKVKQG